MLRNLLTSHSPCKYRRFFLVFSFIKCCCSCHQCVSFCLFFSRFVVVDVVSLKMYHAQIISFFFICIENQTANIWSKTNIVFFLACSHHVFLCFCFMSHLKKSSLVHRTTTGDWQFDLEWKIHWKFEKLNRYCHYWIGKQSNVLFKPKSNFSKFDFCIEN